MVRRAWVFSAALVAVIALSSGCSDASGPKRTDRNNGLPGLIVSPIMHVGASARIIANSTSRATARKSFADATSGMNSYVSLPPGSVPGGVVAAIRDGSAGTPLAVTMSDGGFDPVGIAANVGDTLFVAVTSAGTAEMVHGFERVVAYGAPTVVRASPPRGSKDVALNANIVVVFSAPLDATTVDTVSIQLLRGATPVAGTVRFADSLHLRVEFHPASLLAPHTDYELIVTQAVRDQNGVALDSAVTVPFTTGSTAPATNLVFAWVSVGYNRTCGVTTTGAAYCWGDNYTGGLGDGTYTNSATPVRVAGGLTFSTLSTSAFHTCGLTTAGAAYCWGTVATGNPIGFSATPVPVAGGLTFASVSAGYVHSCGVTTAGAAYCWGEGYDGELGDGSPETAEDAPQAVAGGLAFASVSAGGDQSCGVTITGAAYCWGMDTMGELGIGTSGGPDSCPNFAVAFNACSFLPLAVAGGLTFKTISAGYASTCGLTTSGDPYCWGDLVHDLLASGINTPTGPEKCADLAGIGAEWGPDTLPCSHVPRIVAPDLKLASISTGTQDWFVCGLSSAGAAYCWGQSPVGGSSTRLAAVPGGLTFKELSSGLSSTCGVTTAGVAYCWGANENGQLGDGTTTPSAVPVKVVGQP